MLEKLLALGAYTMGNQIDFRRADGRSVNLGSFDAERNVTVAPAQRALVDELLRSSATPTLDPVPAPKSRKKKPVVDTTEAVPDDEPALGSLVDD